MIEHCTNCGQDHETGDREPIHGVPVKECVNIYHYDPMYMHPGYIKQLHHLGLIDAIHVLPANDPRSLSYALLQTDPN